MNSLNITSINLHLLNTCIKTIKISSTKIQSRHSTVKAVNIWRENIISAVKSFIKTKSLAIFGVTFLLFHKINHD